MTTHHIISAASLWRSERARASGDAGQVILEGGTGGGEKQD